MDKNYVSEFTGNWVREGNNNPTFKSEDDDFTASHLQSNTPLNIDNTLPSSTEHEDDRSQMTHSESNEAWLIDKKFTSESTETQRSFLNSEMSYQCTEPAKQDDTDTLLTINQSKQTKTSHVDLLYQKPRLFDCEVENCTYSYKRVLEVIETGVIDLIQPVHEYKQFTNYAKYLKHQRLWKFTRETIRFASACLNDRTNGTIHFGIADNKAGYHEHGQIIGFEIDDKTEYEEELNRLIELSFVSKEHIDSARKCIRPPKFIPVFMLQVTKQRYVIEVDIVPHSAYCGQLAFFVRLPKEAKIRYKKADLEPKALYRREGSTSAKMKNEDMNDYFQKHLNGLVERRQAAEVQIMSKLPSTSSSVRRDNLAQKLTWLLCSGQEQLDSSFYPILVVNRLTSDHTNLSQMRFIQEIDWVAVFDFDHLSQTSGICKMYSEHKVPHIQDPDMYLNLSDVSAYREEIHFPEKTCWIFCNGRADIDHRPLHRVGWNMDSNRSRGVKEAIRFFGNEEVIPKGRAIIVFLILSQDYDVMLEVFSEFSTYFTPKRLMCVAEDEDFFQGWAKGIVGKSCTMDVLQSRSVVGMPIAHINETILRMRGVKLDGQCILPSSTGAPATIKQRDKNMLSDLEILSMNECEEETKSMDYKQLTEFLRSKELLFYQGYPVSWWNFWANDNTYGHVLKRTKHDELKKHVQDALTPETREEMKRVPTVLLYHQPGAGGTTLTKYILWEFKSNYRCCLIKRVTTDTANQLLRLWSHNEKNYKECKPILAAVEKLDEVVFIALQRKIEELWIKKGSVNSGNKPICVLLHCKCYISEDPSRKFLPPFESITLDHALTEKERLWFVHKLDELEKKAKYIEEVFPTHLISFMILKENFSHDYIKNTVSGILAKITEGSPEDRLLKYVALLNTFVSDSSLPVPCCDRLMGVGHYGVRKNVNQHIEFLLSPPAKLLLLEMQKITIGSVKAFKIVHPLVAEEVLRQIMLHKQENIADVTLEFLKSELFKTNSHAKEDLRNMTSEMLKRRKKYEYGDDHETKFSPLIMKILEFEQNDEATNILLQGMELFEDDAMMTQQVARMYLFKKKFEEAKRFAEKAVRQKPDNSFLLDTLAEVYKEQMNSDYMQVKIQQQKISPKEAFNAIELGFRAMEVCQRSQKASLKEKYSQNTSGYIKEVETCFRLMEILLCVEPFCIGSSGRDLLHKYLVDDDFQPKNLSLPWAQYHRRFKILHKYIEKAINWMTNYCTFYREEFFFENSPMQKLKLKLYDFSRDYVFYFGEDNKEPPLEEKDPENANEWRRRKVSTLGCNRFRNIFNLVQDVRKKSDESQNFKKYVLLKFTESKKLLQENKPMNDFDLHGLISLNFAISNLDPSQKGVSPLCQIHEMVKQYIQVMQAESLYPYFFQSLLMWPRENIGLPYDPKLLQDTLKQLKALFSAQQKHRTDESQIGKYRRSPITQFKAKPATVFFLGKGKGLSAFIHTSELQYRNSTNFDLKGDRFWDSTHVRKRLKRLKGIVWSQNVIRAYDILDGNKATIEILTSIPFETVSSRDMVSFYLGFSWTGPVAYNVSRDIDEQELGPETPETRHVPDSEERTTVQETVKPLNYQQYRRQHSKLARTLQQINELKKKKNAGKQLEKNQMEKLSREDDIKEELANLEKEYQQDMESNPEFLQDYY
ncbi:sterile alpha motif domain-containing protein 9-like [Ptychodera flava]|uniref:sterile alpha motif domain-containing protein 9-like n=1 Tax=Ptychodera flava TaxID=63121 RepID=UPI00396A6C42